MSGFAVALSGHPIGWLILRRISSRPMIIGGIVHHRRIEDEETFEDFGNAGFG